MPLDPLTAQRPHLELYIRWMQESRRYKPSTVSRRIAVAAGFLPNLRLYTLKRNSTTSPSAMT